MRRAWAALIGGAVGLFISDSLNLLHLHWVNHLVIGLLVLFIVVGSVVARRRGNQRS